MSDVARAPSFRASSDPLAAEPPPAFRLLHHATGVGRRVGAVEHRSRRLRLLPHQCHGGEDPHAGKRPLHPPVCDHGAVRGPHPAHDLHTLEKTLKPPPRDSLDYVTAHT